MYFNFIKCVFDVGEKTRIKVYAVTIETMLSYARWVIILVYFIVDESEDIEKHQILVGLLIEDKMFKMWIGESYSETNVMKDFISIK